MTLRWLLQPRNAQHNAIRQLFIQLLFILVIFYSSSNTHETLYPVAYDQTDPDYDQHQDSNKLLDEKEILNYTKVSNNNQTQSQTLECFPLATTSHTYSWSGVRQRVLSCQCSSLYPDLDGLIDLLKENGYTAKDAGRKPSTEHCQVCSVGSSGCQASAGSGCCS